MYFTTRTITCALLMATIALPAHAQNRDSDGDVISVLHPVKPPVIGGWYPRDPNEDRLYYVMEGGKAVEFSVPTLADGPGLAKVSLNGTTYQAEQSGNDLILRENGTGPRIAARLVQAGGKRVNPTSFALE